MTLKKWEELPEGDRKIINEIAAKGAREGQEVYEQAVEKNRYEWEKHGSPFEDYESLPEGLKKDTEEIGEMLGRTGREFHIGLATSLEISSVPGKECLQPDEVEAMYSGGMAVLSPERRLHVEQCSFCNSMPWAMILEVD